jgi:hypothetical protein
MFIYGQGSFYNGMREDNSLQAKWLLVKDTLSQMGRFISLYGHYGCQYYGLAD